MPSITPSALSETLHQVALNLGITSVPGLTPAATVVLLYTTLWCVPFFACIFYTAKEFTGGWVGRYREGGILGLVIGLSVGAGYILAVALYLLAAVSVIFWTNQEMASQYPSAKACIDVCAQLWAKWFTNLSPVFRLSPIATLGCAVLGNVAVAVFAKLLTWPYLAARERRTRQLLSRLESSTQPLPPQRSTIKYF